MQMIFIIDIMIEEILENTKCYIESQKLIVDENVDTFK